MNFYDAAYLASLPVLAPAIAYKRFKHGKYKDSLPGMLGKRLPPRPLDPAQVERCWLHSVSVGETIAAGSIFREIERRRLGWEFLATTTTETGQAQALQTLAGANTFAFAPADFSWVVRRFHEVYRPSLYCFFETEIWPNNLAECGRRGLPVYMINGKMSDRSSRRYAKFANVFRGPLSNVRRFFVQTESDAERIARVVGTETRITVTGNVKFDALPDPLSGRERSEIRRAWGFSENQVALIAGSTHPGEEEIVLRAFRSVRDAEPKARLVIAPRHPERFEEVAELLMARGWDFHRTSEGPWPGEGSPTVVLLDQMRVLAKSYGAAEVALVAGSWAPIGGHNLLEAAIHGIPVVRGPNMFNQREIVRVLGPEQGAPQVSEHSLAKVLLSLVRDPEKRQRMGERAAAAARSSKGAAHKTVDLLLEDLERFRT